MRAMDRIRMGGAGVALLALLVAVPAGGVTAQTVDCTAPDLEGVEAELAVARAAVVAGNRDALEAAVDSARAQLDAIAEACFDGTATPAPSLPPIDLDASATVGDRTVRYPGDLVVIADGLMEPVEEGDLRADVLTVADSLASGELLQSQPESPVPDGFRIISLAIGDPAAAMASVGAMSIDDEIPNEPLGALRALVAEIEADAGGEVAIELGDVTPIPFPEGPAGATVAMSFRDPDGTLLLEGAFVLRPLPDGDWALGVAFGAEDRLEAARTELAAVLAAIGEPA